jgi:hypothetical protein
MKILSALLSWSRLRGTDQSAGLELEQRNAGWRSEELEVGGEVHDAPG